MAKGKEQPESPGEIHRSIGGARRNPPTPGLIGTDFPLSSDEGNSTVGGIELIFNS